MSYVLYSPTMSWGKEGGKEGGFLSAINFLLERRAIWEDMGLVTRSQYFGYELETFGEIHFGSLQALIDSDMESIKAAVEATEQELAPQVLEWVGQIDLPTFMDEGRYAVPSEKIRSAMDGRIKFGLRIDLGDLKVAVHPHGMSMQVEITYLGKTQVRRV